MAVKHAVDNEQRLFVTYYSGAVTESDVRSAISALEGLVNKEGTYRELVIFKRGVDLSALDRPALNELRQEIKDAYHRHGLRRGESAAVVDTALEAQMIVPLWNALCATDPGMDLGFTIFSEVAPALAFLAVPADVAARVAALTAPDRR